MNHLSWVLIVILVFGAAYAGSLTFVYVEGDDASSIAYHALGRDANLQPRYGAYQAGADLIVRLLPAKEGVLRVSAMMLTSLAAICVCILMLALAFDWMKGAAVTHKALVALLVLLACPELIYLGLVYEPTMLAMSFVLAAHLLLRRTVREWEWRETRHLSSWLKIGFSSLLFGFGAACRWDVVLYGGVIFADLVIGSGLWQTNNTRSLWDRFRIATVWGILALLLWGAGIVSSGYGVRIFSENMKMAAHVAGQERNYISIVGACQTLFTPAFIVLGLWGWVTLSRQLRWLSFLSFVATIGYLSTRLAWPKEFLVFVPPLVLCVAAGFSNICQGDRPVRRKRALQAGAILLVLLPWVFGVQATLGDTAWGPGFELRPYDRPEGGGKHFALTIGAGAAFPTPEGPRPLFGHAAIIFGGGWRSLVRSLEEERRQAIQTAIEAGMPYVVIQGDTGYAVAELAGMGFKTRDAKFVRTRDAKDGGRGTEVKLRFFSNDDGRHVILWKLALARPELFQDVAKLREIIALGGADRVVVTGYGSGLRTLYKGAPDAMQKLGSTSAIVNLRQLIESISKQNKSDESLSPRTE